MCSIGEILKSSGKAPFETQGSIEPPRSLSTYDLVANIVKGKVDWSKRQKFWFSLDPVEEKLVSVTITVPIPGEIHGEFCTRCGEEIIGAGIYCSRCGEKVSGSTASDME